MMDEEDDLETDEAFCFSLPEYSSSNNNTTPVDTYHEDECDVGPRPFQAAFVPDDVMDAEFEVMNNPNMTDY